jgi:hypothetical protein
LSGKITDASTHQPIVGAQVSYQYPFTESSTISDASGAYSFHVGMAELHPGETSFGVFVSISSAGYATLGKEGSY